MDKKLDFDTETLNSFKIKDTMLDRTYRSTPELREQVKQVYATGDYSMRELAEMCGVCEKTISRWLMDDARRQAYLQSKRAYNKKSYAKNKAEINKKTVEYRHKTQQYKNDLLLVKLKYMD